MKSTKEDPELVDALRRDFAYDPDTGHVIHIRPRQKVVAGSRAGSVTRFGYRAIHWNKATYREHRIIFALQTGHWPAEQIDHVNNVKDDNRWCNLREATDSQNQRNTFYKSASGVKGAYFNKKTKRWQSLISVKGKVRYLGYFDTPEQAHEAYCAAARELVGEFARTWPSFLD